MHGKVELHDDARAEFIDATAWYAERDPDVADEFYEAIKKALQTIGADPERWPIERGHTRRYILRRFPFKLAYIAKAERVFVLAVAHKSRRPGYWKVRE